MSLGLELAFQAMLLMDARQSQYGMDRPAQFKEYNPLVRKYGVKKYFIVAGLGHAAVSYTIPKKYLPAWQYGSLAVEGFVIGRNAHIGVKMRF
jgi:hypothetical protein